MIRWWSSDGSAKSRIIMSCSTSISVSTNHSNYATGLLINKHKESLISRTCMSIFHYCTLRCNNRDHPARYAVDRYIMMLPKYYNLYLRFIQHIDFCNLRIPCINDCYVSTTWPSAPHDIRRFLLVNSVIQCNNNKDLVLIKRNVHISLWVSPNRFCSTTSPWCFEGRDPGTWILMYHRKSEAKAMQHMMQLAQVLG